MKNVFETLSKVKELAKEVRNAGIWMKKHKDNYELLEHLDDRTEFVLGVIEDSKKDYEEQKAKREKAIEELIDLILG